MSKRSKSASPQIKAEGGLVGLGHNGGPALDNASPVAHRIADATEQPGRLAYRIPDAAEQLGIAHSTLYELRKRGLITFTTIAGRQVVTRRELERFLADAEANPEAHSTSKRIGRVFGPNLGKNRPAEG